jgi:stearoyl-CoA desaturase (Delta-9 desaturase)
MAKKYWTRWLHLFFFVGFIASFFVNPTLLIASVLIYIFFEIFGGNAGLHRFYGHRSFETGPLREKFLRWATHHIGMSSVITWVGMHRWHHKYSDTEKDIHSPTQNGLWSIVGGIPDIRIPPKMIKDTLTPELKWWHEHFFHYHVAVIIILSIISLDALIYLYCVPNFMCLLSGMFIAYFPHRTGEDVQYSLITEIYTLGEGGHDYHHDNPKDYRFSKYDVTAWVIENVLKK